MKSRKPNRKRDNDGQLIAIIPDVRPLNQRETKMNTRKGMIKAVFIIPQGMTGKQFELWRQNSL